MLYKRIVIKVGTSTLVGGTGRIDLGFLDFLAGQIHGLRKVGADVLVVTSGAIHAGAEIMGLSHRPATIPEKQAAAAVGQGRLMQMYLQAFAGHGITVGQVLLTREDFRDRKRYINARNTMLELFRHGIVPILNENDTVAVDEIRVGDNDTLAALVASNLEADLLILLSDIDGLYDGHPGSASASIIPVVKKIDDRIRSIAGGAGSDCGTGGMRTKIDAAAIAMDCGVTMIIANGRRENVIADIVAGKQVGTVFESQKTRRLCGRKRWIAFGAAPRGGIKVNEGAKTMICEHGKSLLAAGITDVIGSFSSGDMVKLMDADGNQFARGFVNYSAGEIEKLKGEKSSEIQRILGYKDFDEIIHRDNMALQRAVSGNRDSRNNEVV